MAYLFKKKDLQYRYHWTTATEGDQASLRGFPNHAVLNREEGYAVLAFINRCASAYVWTPDKGLSGQQFEALIHQCPPHLQSQKTIKEWIEANWYKYY